MSRYHSYLNSAREILSIYNGKEPFASFLKKYFAQHKKYGSTDRKQISHLCYCYFRSAPPPPEGGIKKPPTGIEEQILIGLFLCSTEPNEMLKELRPEWNEKIKLPLREKLSVINYDILSVFPWKEELSEGIDHEKFCESFFIQPDLFLRLRPGKNEIVKQKLQTANIDFKIISDSCFALDNSSKIDKIISLDEEAVVQDYSSQQIQQFFPEKKSAVWDCCAGSGGKSIMLYDAYPTIELAVSDVRESILMNLKKRFSKAGIKNYKSFVADLTNEPELKRNFDFIIADVPCTGSGTWSRTPEQLFYFDRDSIGKFNRLQQKIVSNVIPYLKSGGHFLYITCSVFKKENEEVVNFIKEKFNLELIKMEVLKGSDKKADTMFAALLRKLL